MTTACYIFVSLASENVAMAFGRALFHLDVEYFDLLLHAVALAGLALVLDNLAPASALVAWGDGLADHEAHLDHLRDPACPAAFRALGD